MTDSWAFTCPVCQHRYKWKGGISNKPPCPKCSGKTASVVKELSEDCQDAIEQCESILADIAELPDRAYDFGESVAERVEGIRETIEGSGRVTNGQKTALDNMEAGVDRWF